jgi:hypothetical protein
MPLDSAILALRNKWQHPQKSEVTKMIEIYRIIMIAAKMTPAPSFH